MIATTGNYSASVLASKIGSNIKIFADTFAGDDHCLSAAVNFPSIPPVSINKTLKWNWLNDALYLRTGHLNKCLLALNFFGPPENPSDHKHCFSLSKSIASSLRECGLAQDVQHSKHKPVHSGRQATLMYFTTLLFNLTFASLCYLELKKKTTHEILIAWLLKDLSKVVKHPKCRAWYEKPQTERPWLVRQCITYLH